jgi:hypothetical protein
MLVFSNGGQKNCLHLFESNLTGFQNLSGLVGGQKNCLHLFKYLGGGQKKLPTLQHLNQ